MKTLYVQLIFLFSLLFFIPYASADTFSILQNSLNVIYLDTDTLYGGNNIIIDKVSSTFGDPTFDAMPLVRYNLGSDSYNYYSQLPSFTYLPNHYANSIAYTNSSKGLYPSQANCNYVRAISANDNCGGINGVNTYWKTSTLELYVARTYDGRWVYDSTNEANFTIYKRDNINNYWVKITDFYSGSSNIGLTFNGWVFLQSTFDPMYNLMNLVSWDGTSVIRANYQPQSFNTTNNGWYHDTNYNGFTYNVNEVVGKVWKLQKSTATTNTKILAGKYIFSDTYPNGDAHLMNTTTINVNNDLITATWYNGNESRYIWAKSYGSNLDIYQTNGWTQQPNQQWKPINLTTITDITSCILIKNFNNVHITDIDCKNNGECVFVGHWLDGTRYYPLLFKYDGENCQQYTLSGVASNSTIETVVYEPNTDSYYLGGRKLFAKYRFTTPIGEGTAQNYPLCIPSTNQLCIDPFFIQGDPTVYCGIDDVINCADTCQNYYNTTYNTTIGQCIVNETSQNLTQQQCTQSPDYCNIIGQRICGTTNAYRECGLQGNGCYAYGGNIACSLNQYCFNGYCYAYDTGGNGTTNVSLNPQLPFTIGVQPSNYTVVEPQGNKITISTPDLLFTQQYNVQASPTTAQNQSYASWVCNYKETPLFTAGDDTIYASDYLWAFPQTTSGIIWITLVPNSTTSSSVYDIIFSGNFGDDIIANLTFVNNISTTESCLYRKYQDSVQQIYCYDYSTGYFSGVQIGLFPDFDTETYTIGFRQNTYNVYSPSMSQVYTEPLFFQESATEMSQLDIKLVNNQSFKLTNINVSVLPTIPSYSLIVNNVYGYIYCAYSQDGCFPLRIFYNTKNTNAYNNYKDLTACITLNNQQYTFSGETTNFFNDLFGGEKDYGLAIFILIIVFIVSAVFIGGLIENMSIAVGFSSIVSLGLAIVLAYFGWLPVWLLILFFIIAGGIGVVFIRGVING